MALANKTRLRMLNLMRGREICVGFLVDVLGESQPKISRHLAYLRGAGIVEARRDGKWMHYKIIEPDNDFAAQVMRDTLMWLDSHERMRDECEKLEKICCSPDNTAAKVRSPKPNVFANANVNDKPRELEIFLL